MSEIFGLAGQAAGFWTGGLVDNNQSPLQAMSADQMAEYQRRQGDPRNMPWEMSMFLAAQKAWNANRVRLPTMTLAEWDARRAAFRP